MALESRHGWLLPDIFSLFCKCPTRKSKLAALSFPLGKFTMHLFDFLYQAVTPISTIRELITCWLLFFNLTEHGGKINSVLHLRKPVFPAFLHHRQLLIQRSWETWTIHQRHKNEWRVQYCRRRNKTRPARLPNSLRRRGSHDCQRTPRSLLRDFQRWWIWGYQKGLSRVSHMSSAVEVYWPWQAGERNRT